MRAFRPWVGDPNLEESFNEPEPSLPSRPAEGRILRVRLPGLRRAVVDAGRGRYEGNAAHTAGAALPGPGQARDLSLHERGAFTRRYLRPQAEAHGRRRQGVRPARPDS